MGRAEEGGGGARDWCETVEVDLFGIEGACMGWCGHLGPQGYVAETLIGNEALVSLDLRLFNLSRTFTAPLRSDVIEEIGAIRASGPRITKRDVRNVTQHRYLT